MLSYLLKGNVWTIWPVSPAGLNTKLTIYNAFKARDATSGIAGRLK
jgi:hypothetical protein